MKYLTWELQHQNFMQPIGFGEVISVRPERC